MLLIAVTLLGALVVSSEFHSTNATGTLGLVKGSGPTPGSAQPYEPVGPWIDGILVSQFLVNQNNEWLALKAGTIDLYDWPLRHSQLIEFNSPCTGPPPACVCLPAPDAPAGIAPCPSGQAPIQHEVTLRGIQNFGKFEIDLQNAAFPTNLLAFRQAVAFATDKEQFITNVLGGDGAPNYAVVGCPALCAGGPDGKLGPFYSTDLSLECDASPCTSTSAGAHAIDDLWVKPTLNEAGLTCLSVTGTPMPFTAGGHCNAPAGTIDPARVAAANALLDSLGFSARDALGFRLDNGPGCVSRTVPNGAGSLIIVNNCGKELQPVFYVSHDDPNREQLGFQLQAVLQNSLGIDMNLVAATGQYPSQFRHFIDVNRKTLVTPVFGNFAYNFYTGGWGLGPDPTYIDDLYDSQFIRPFLTNYPNYNDALFNTKARGLRAAQAGPPSDFFANARSLAFGAEQEFNDTVGIIDVWTDIGPVAYRNYHVDSDVTLNGLRWEGIQNRVGVGPDNKWTWLNAHLVGAPLHDPNHPVFVKWGWKTDILDSPNPVDSLSLGASWDRPASGLAYDSLNNLATDDPSFDGDLPWMASLPPKIPTVVADGTTFPNGEMCTSDAPPSGCSLLSYQLRSDLTFAASLDGKITSVQVVPFDVRFSILDAKNSPTSFLRPAYVHVQDVVVTGPLTFDVYERNAAVWARRDIGATPILSVQHWCQELHDSWPGLGVNATGLTNCLAAPTSSGFSTPSFAGGWPDAGVNTLSSTSGHQLPGPPVSVDLGSSAFVYDSEVSFPRNATDGPVLYRARQTPGLTLPTGTATCQPSGTGCGYSAAAPSDGYFTNNLGATSAGLNIGGWRGFHLAGNINWYCTATTSQPCSAGITSENGPLPSPDSVINIFDLNLVATHFGETPGTAANPCASVVGGCPFGAQPWDISGPGGTPDGTVNIFDLTRVASHFGQSFLSLTEIGGGSRITSTSVRCLLNPTRTSYTCTATVTDIATGTVVTPSGAVEFSTTTPGTWNPYFNTPNAGGLCYLNSQGVCSSVFTPTTPPALGTIVAQYVPTDEIHTSSFGAFP
jgi:hypothetical protein